MLTARAISSGNADNPALRRPYEAAFPKGEQIPNDDIIVLLRAAWTNMSGQHEQ
jgi:hypothetical protein